jgi:putative NADH-flavin reductase
VKVVLYGATGKVGSIILKELVDRGHAVIAAARTPEKVQKLKNVTAVQDNLSDPKKTASIVKDADAVISAYGPPPDDTNQLVGATDCLIQRHRGGRWTPPHRSRGSRQPFRCTGCHAAGFRARSQGMDSDNRRSH